VTFQFLAGTPNHWLEPWQERQDPGKTIRDERSPTAPGQLGEFG
jgi:hypothetical protein